MVEASASLGVGERADPPLRGWIRDVGLQLILPSDERSPNRERANEVVPT